MSILDIKKAKDVALSNNKFIVLYGEGGVGKTTFATNNENNPKTLIIQTQDDGGVSSVLKLKEEQLGNIDFISLANIGSPAQELGPILQELKDGDHDYDIIILDPFTNVRNLEAEAVKNQNNGKMTFVQWGEVKSRMNAIFELLIGLKKKSNVIIIAHEEKESSTNDNTGTSTSKIVPALSKGVNEIIVQNSDEIIRITMDKEGHRHYNFHGTEDILAKTRKFGSEPVENKIKKDLKITDII